MDKKYLALAIAIGVIIIGSSVSKPKNKPVNQTNQPNQEMYLGQTAEQNKNNKLCDWVDQSDIIIKVKFANENIKKDTSYQTGFMFGPNYFNARLARNGCDYRTGFKYSELKGKGIAQIGVVGYSDNKVRTIVGAPININFDKDGKPDIGSYIEVTITD